MKNKPEERNHQNNNKVLIKLKIIAISNLPKYFKDAWQILTSLNLKKKYPYMTNNCWIRIKNNKSLM